VINKPAGLVVHPGAGNKKGTLVNALIYYLPKLERIGDKLRPGIVHRLDKDTSGAMIIAKNDEAFQNLVKQFKEKEIKKEYLALVYGKVKPKKGKIIAPIRRDYHNRKQMAIAGTGKGKEAETEYEVEKYFGDQFTLLKIFPKTGRTHQIRVHLNSIGYSVVGDETYKPKQNFVNKAKELGLRRQFLHAKSIEIKMLNGTKKKFIAPLPIDLKTATKKLNDKSKT
ncbi:RluA family pseudouridine synthase, partial [Patescibacteria group bacterium]